MLGEFVHSRVTSVAQIRAIKKIVEKYDGDFLANMPYTEITSDEQERKILGGEKGFFSTKSRFMDWARLYHNMVVVKTLAGYYMIITMHQQAKGRFPKVVIRNTGPTFFSGPTAHADTITFMTKQMRARIKGDKGRWWLENYEPEIYEDTFKGF